MLPYVYLFPREHHNPPPHSAIRGNLYESEESGRLGRTPGQHGIPRPKTWYSRI